MGRLAEELKKRFQTPQEVARRRRDLTKRAMAHRVCPKMNEQRKCFAHP
jgi:hypothetical protein